MSARDVADAALDGMRDGKFLLLPHQAVAEYFSRKSSNYDRWVGGMRKFRRSLQE
jgi:hypothetical protein